MQVGVVDLGHVGAHMARRLLAAGHRCVVFDRCPLRVAEVAAEMAYGAASLSDLANELDPPRAIFLTCPAADVDATIAELLPRLEPGDIIVNCADSHFADDVRRAALLAARKIHYVDVGIGGRIGCPAQGYCLTIGGDAEFVWYLDPVFRQLAPRREPLAPGQTTASQGYLHCGPVGAGRFVNMVHNGIQRCLVAAYAEGFGILRAAEATRDEESDTQGRRETHQYQFDLPQIAEVWRHGSLVASAVLDVTAHALETDTTLQGPAGAARLIEEDWRALRDAAGGLIPDSLLASAVYAGTGTRHEPDFSNLLVAAVQQQCTGGQQNASRA